MEQRVTNDWNDHFRQINNEYANRKDTFNRFNMYQHPYYLRARHEDKEYRRHVAELLKRNIQYKDPRLLLLRRVIEDIHSRDDNSSIGYDNSTLLQHPLSSHSTLNSMNSILGEQHRQSTEERRRPPAYFTTRPSRREKREQRRLDNLSLLCNEAVQRRPKNADEIEPVVFSNDEITKISESIKKQQSSTTDASESSPLTSGTIRLGNVNSFGGPRSIVDVASKINPADLLEALNSTNGLTFINSDRYNRAAFDDDCSDNDSSDEDDGMPGLRVKSLDNDGYDTLFMARPNPFVESMLQMRKRPSYL